MKASRARTAPAGFPSRRPFPAGVFGHPRVALVLIGVFILLAVGPDLVWPSRKSYFATYTCDFKNFTVLHPVPAGSFFAPGGGGQELYSPLYMGLLRGIYALVPHRLAAMRLLSVAAAAAGLGLLFLTARRLYPPAQAGLFLFLLVTSPIYLESARAFGYQSLSHLAVILTVYLTVRSRERAGWAAAAAVSAFSTLTLYVTARPAAAFPVLYYLLDWRNCWKRLLLYLAVFVILVTGAGLAEGRSPVYPWRYFTSPDEQAGLWPVKDGRVDWAGLDRTLARNTGLAAGYLLNIGRLPFADRESSSRLFNPVYTPFLLLGLAGIWFGNRRGRNAILILLFLFFLLPLASREIQPRRILVSLYPVYLLIASGMSLFYRFVISRRGQLGRLAVPLLLAVGVWDVGEFVFRVSRPRLNYSRSELAAVARFVEANQVGVPHIRYYKEIDELIMGNPCFIPRPEENVGTANIFAEERWDFRETLEIFSAWIGEDFIYLYIDPPLRFDPETIRWAGRAFGSLVRQGRVPGTENLYFLRAGFSRVAPNLIFQAWDDMEFRIRGLPSPTRSSGGKPETCPELFDGDAGTFVLIDPPAGGAPTAIDFELGEAIGKPVRSVSFRVPAGRSREFFRRAAFLGERAGGGWERLAEFVVPSPPAGGEWLNFEFENDMPRSRYRLEFAGGTWSGGRSPLALAGIWMFDRAGRELKVEKILTE